jgi:hypothetical protein
MFLSSHLSLKGQTLTFENSTPSVPLTSALSQKNKKTQGLRKHRQSTN